MLWPMEGMPMVPVDAFNDRTGNRWLGYQSSFRMAERAAGVTFSKDTTHLFHVVICCDGTDARVYHRRA